MQPLSETVVAFGELEPRPGEDDLLERLVTTSEQVRALVPACTAMSVHLLHHGVTFTLVATPAELEGLGLPLVPVPGDGLGAGQDDEATWHEHGDATSATGVLSTLSLPVVVAGTVTGDITLYGATWDCFEGQHPALAEVLGAWAQGATTNADLTFSSRDVATDAPRVLRDAGLVDVVTGLVAGSLHLDLATARARLENASRHTGLDLVDTCRVVLVVLRPG